MPVQALPQMHVRQGDEVLSEEDVKVDVATLKADANNYGAQLDRIEQGLGSLDEKFEKGLNQLDGKFDQGLGRLERKLFGPEGDGGRIGRLESDLDRVKTWQAIEKGVVAFVVAALGLIATYAKFFRH